MAVTSYWSCHFCIKCKVDIKQDDPVIVCDGCGGSVHRPCSSLNASELKVIDLRGKRVLKFYCDDCQSGVKMIPKLIKKLNELEIMITDMKSRGDSATSEEVIINELFERQRKSNNIMFYNLPESAQAQNDLAKVKEISKEITKEDLNIVKVLRVGKKNKNGARPLKVIYQSPEEASLVIKGKRNINKQRKVFIDVDMTPLQMNNMKKIKEELLNRRKEGEDVFIKYIRGIPQIAKNSKN